MLLSLLHSNSHLAISADTEGRGEAEWVGVCRGAEDPLSLIFAMGAWTEQDGRNYTTSTAAGAEDPEKSLTHTQTNTCVHMSTHTNRCRQTKG